MSSRLASHLTAARRRQFVGRQDGKALFQTLLDGQDPPFYVLHVFGPGGIGKSSLLREMMVQCEQAQSVPLYLNGDYIEPTPDAFSAALRSAAGLEPGAPVLASIGARAQKQRHVVFIDTYESLLPLDDWLREAFLPELPDNVFVVIASREPPAPAWRRDPGWQELLETLPLRNLSPEESEEFLVRRRVPADQHPVIRDFTHGHPLALSLVADLFDQRPDFMFQPDAAPDIIRTLLEQFVKDLPGAQHRMALDICSLVRGTTEALLSEMMGLPDAHDLFTWLRRLSFIDSGPRGLFPHDLAREVLHTDLRWRNHDRFVELHDHARKYYASRLQLTTGTEQQRTLFDYIYLHRDNPVVRPFYDWQASATSHVPDVMRPRDVQSIVAMVTQHEGKESGRLVAYWLERQPQSFLVFRTLQGNLEGFMTLLPLHKTTEEDAAVDPTLRSAQAHLARHGGLRPGETATYFRHWMAADTYQSVSSLQSMIFVNCVRHYLTTPNLVYTFFACAEPDFWKLVFDYADLHRAPELDFTVDERRFGVYVKNWRAMPPLAWLDLMGDRELGMQVEAAATPVPAEQMVALSREEFDSAVDDALRTYHRPDRLVENPLLRSRLVLERAGTNANSTQRVSTLLDVLRSALQTLQATPKDAKLHRAVLHTYIQPAPTQEAAAELLDLPFSTYRRHLRSGVSRIAEILWSMETNRLGI